LGENIQQWYQQNSGNEVIVGNDEVRLLGLLLTQLEVLSSLDAQLLLCLALLALKAKSNLLGGLGLYGGK